MCCIYVVYGMSAAHDLALLAANDGLRGSGCAVKWGRGSGIDARAPNLRRGGRFSVEGERGSLDKERPPVGEKRAYARPCVRCENHSQALSQKTAHCHAQKHNRRSLGRHQSIYHAN